MLKDENKAGYREYPELAETASFNPEIAEVFSEIARQERVHFATLTALQRRYCRR